MQVLCIISQDKGIKMLFNRSQAFQLELSANKMYEKTNNVMWKDIGDIAYNACKSDSKTEYLVVPDECFVHLPLPNWQSL